MRKYSTIPVHLQAAGIWVDGHLFLPDAPQATVIVALGNEPVQENNRLQVLVRGMLENGYAVCCTDLLSTDEAHLYSNQFCIRLHAARVSVLTQWIIHRTNEPKLPVLYFSYRLGAPAALLAASGNKAVAGIVCFSGRQEQVLDQLKNILQPVLLVYGEEDSIALSLGQESCAAIGGIAEMQTVSGKGQLANTLMEELIRVTLRWFDACIHKIPKYA